MDQFARHGYLVLEGLIPPDLVDRLKPEVDRWSDDGLRADSLEATLSGDTTGPPLVELEMPAHGQLSCLPDLIRVLDKLLGRDFVFHHMQAAGRTQPAAAPLMANSIHVINGIIRERFGSERVPPTLAGQA